MPEKLAELFEKLLGLHITLGGLSEAEQRERYESDFQEWHTTVEQLRSRLAEMGREVEALRAKRKREYFAGQAISGILASDPMQPKPSPYGGTHGVMPWSTRMIVCRAREIADALIIELNNTQAAHAEAEQERKG